MTVDPTRIVICDDHPLFREGLAAALEAEPDFAIAAQAGTLAELMLVLDRVRADLLLLDIDLPDGAGDDHVAALTELIPVLVISAHDQPDLVRRVMEDGALGLVRKDAEPTELLRLLRRAAQGRTALSGDLAMRVAESLRRGTTERSFAQMLQALSPRQREVAEQIAKGATNREIAEELCISEGTVKNYVTRILEVVGVSDRTKLAVLAVKHQASS